MGCLIFTSAMTKLKLSLSTQSVCSTLHDYDTGVYALTTKMVAVTKAAKVCRRFQATIFPMAAFDPIFHLSSIHKTFFGI